MLKKDTNHGKLGRMPWVRCGTDSHCGDAQRYADLRLDVLRNVASRKTPCLWNGQTTDSMRPSHTHTQCTFHLFRQWCHGAPHQAAAIHIGETDFAFHGAWMYWYEYAPQFGCEDPRKCAGIFCSTCLSNGGHSSEHDGVYLERRCPACPHRVCVQSHVIIALWVAALQSSAARRCRGRIDN